MTVDVYTLIETHWNVKKKEEKITSKAEVNFNRNTLKCKGYKAEYEYLYSRTLIETHWNVKRKIIRKSV